MRKKNQSNSSLLTIFLVIYIIKHPKFFINAWRWILTLVLWTKVWLFNCYSIYFLIFLSSRKKEKKFISSVLHFKEKSIILYSPNRLTTRKLFTILIKWKIFSTLRKNRRFYAPFYIHQKGFTTKILLTTLMK